jgi:hypothetical protein
VSVTPAQIYELASAVAADLSSLRQDVREASLAFGRVEQGVVALDCAVSGMERATDRLDASLGRIEHRLGSWNI